VNTIVAFLRGGAAKNVCALFGHQACYNNFWAWCQAAKSQEVRPVDEICLKMQKPVMNWQIFVQTE